MWLSQFLRDLRVPTLSHKQKITKVSSSPYSPIRLQSPVQYFHSCTKNFETASRKDLNMWPSSTALFAILAEGAIALSVTHSGGALFASWKLLQFPSSLIVKVILAIFMGASAQHDTGSSFHLNFFWMDFQKQRHSHYWEVYLTQQVKVSKLTWLVLGGDPAARSHRVEQLTALWGL